MMSTTLAKPGGRRFSPRQIRAIRQRYQAGRDGSGPRVTYLALAEEFGGVSSQTISGIVNRHIYRDVDPPLVVAATAKKGRAA